jgi:hypothetical protein
MLEVLAPFAAIAAYEIYKENRPRKPAPPGEGD